MTIKIKGVWFEPVRKITAFVVCDAARKGSLPTAFFRLTGKERQYSGRIMLQRNAPHGFGHTYVYDPMSTELLSSVPIKGLNERTRLRSLSEIMSPNGVVRSDRMAGLSGGLLEPRLNAKTSGDAGSLMRLLRSMQPNAAQTQVLTLDKYVNTDSFFSKERLQRNSP